MKNNIKILIQEILSIVIIVGICLAISIPVQNHYIKKKCELMIEKYQDEHKQEIEDKNRTYVIEMQHRIFVENNLKEKNYEEE